MRPLAGRTVLVTRPADQSVELVRHVRASGARAIVAPAIEIAPIRSAALTRALRELSAGGFAWITLTSRATVEMLASRLDGPKDVRANVAAIGEGTSAAFRAWARRTPDLMPTTFTTVGLARAFPRGDGRVLCARADIAPPGLEDALAAKGWSPERVDAYRTRMTRTLPAEARTALRDGVVDAITFTSASTVRGFVGAMGVVRGNPKVVVHRAGHGGGGTRARPQGLRRGTPAHDRRRGRGARAGPRRVIGRIARMSFPQQRPRRMRRTPALRALIRETDLAPRQLIAPLFVKEGIADAAPIASMPGQFQHTLESLRKEAVEIASRGVTAFMVFAVPERKDADGSEASNPDGIAQRAFTMLHDELGDEHVVIGDLCLDEYTDHGHCGVLSDVGDVDNDATLERYREHRARAGRGGRHTWSDRAA